MRKLLLAALVTGLLVIPAANAEAGWFMRYGQAKNESKLYAKETCEELRECTAWGAGKCIRRSPSSFSCVIAIWAAPRNVGEEDIECQQVLHWGVRTGGYIVLKNAGEPRCA